MKSKRPVSITFIFLGLILWVSSFAIWLSEKDGYKPRRGNPQATEPLELGSNPGEITIINALDQDADTPVINTDTVVLEILAPENATEMQIGFDPTFTQVQWQPVTNQITLKTKHTGYQNIFARYRSSEISVERPISVTGLIINSNSNTKSSEPIWVRPLSAQHLVIRIEPGKMVWDENKNYISDEIDLNHQDLNKNWKVTEKDSGKILATSVEVLSRGNGSGFEGENPITAKQFDVTLNLKTYLEEGKTYVINPPTTNIKSFEYTHEPSTTISPAIQINQNGWAPTDPKFAYLGGWYKNLKNINYSEDLKFNLVDADTNKIVLTGNPKKRPADNVNNKDLTGSEVYELDFSSYTEKGTYKICVEKVGCSYNFEISSNVWLDIATKVARSTYQQRSGIELSLPYTSVSRPRPRHPDNGTVVTKSRYSLLEAEQDKSQNMFIDLVRKDTGETNDSAWGGHHDAGDWDRRIQHLWYARAAVDLLDQYPELYETITFNIPESQNQIPDILDEGLWSLDLYKRMQRPDGAISGGVEASEHPDTGTSSWTSDLALFSFEPDAWSSYIYAGVAAEYAVTLKKYDKELSQEYKKSALAAMTWAERQSKNSNKDAQQQVEDQRLVAVAAMGYLTEDEEWFRLFEELSPFNNDVEFLECHRHGICDAAWIYQKSDSSKGSKETLQNIENSFISNAQQILNYTNNTSYSLSVEHPDMPLRWGTGIGGAPKTVGLLRAYHLTNDRRYLDAAKRSSAATLGANPTNTVFITGVGQTPVTYPLMVDSISAGLPVWPGTPVFGNHVLNGDEDWLYRYRLLPVGVETDPSELPYLWSWQDVFFPQFNEFTIHQSHAQALYTFGTFAGIESEESKN